MSAYDYSMCPLFMDRQMQANFAQVVVFFAIKIGIAFATYCIYGRQSAGKKLVGWPYILALALMLVSDVLSIISLLMAACMFIYEGYQWIDIVSNAFFALGVWTLLFVVAYKLNSMLREQLDTLTKQYKGVCLTIAAAMLAITIADFCIWGYTYFTLTEYKPTSDRLEVLSSESKLQVAKAVLYSVIVLVSGASSLKSIFTMRSRQMPCGDLLGWAAGLHFCMFIWTICAVTLSAANLNNDYWAWEVTLAISYIASAARVLCFIALLFIAKHIAWTKAAATTEETWEPAVQEQPFIYQTNGQQDYYQQDYYQQQPIYVQPK